MTAVRAVGADGNLPVGFVVNPRFGGTIAIVHFELRPACLPVFASAAKQSSAF